MSSRSRMHWPEAHPEPDTGPGSYAAWIASLSDGSLEILEAIQALHDGERFPPWAEPLLARIKAEAEAVPVRPNPYRPNTRPVEVRSKLHEAADFGDVLKMTWPGADWQTRAALRTIATALGIPVPEDEPRPMRRTKLPSQVQEPGRPADRQPDRPVVKERTPLPRRPAAAHLEPEPEDDEAEPEHPYLAEDNERCWEPCNSLTWR